MTDQVRFTERCRRAEAHVTGDDLMLAEPVQWQDGFHLGTCPVLPDEFREAMTNPIRITQASE